VFFVPFVVNFLEFVLRDLRGETICLVNSKI